MLLIFSLACAPEPVPPVAAAALAVAPPMPSAVPGPDGMVGRPFSAQQIHDALPNGAMIALRLSGDDGGSVIERWRFEDATDQTVTIHSWQEDEAGQIVQDDGAGTSTWAELVEHAAFPAADTTVGGAFVDVPAGRFGAWTYEVRRVDDAGTAELHRYAFAPELPGPPVLYTVERDGAVVFRMELIERTPRP